MDFHNYIDPVALILFLLACVGVLAIVSGLVWTVSWLF